MIKTRILDLPTQAATHAHPEHQLVVGLQGCADFEVMGQGGAVNRLHACLVPGGEAHAFSGRGHNHMLIMDLPAEAQGLSGYADERLEVLFDRSVFPRPRRHARRGWMPLNCATSIFLCKSTLIKVSAWPCWRVWSV